MSNTTYFRGIRGAITVDQNDRAEILTNTRELLDTLIKENNIHTDDIASIFFSVTQDLNAEFPAVAARDMGLVHTPLLCLNEIDVPGKLKLCIRVLMHVNTPKAQKEVRHAYLRNAVSLRPDHTN
ncbi:chorismate mutase [bacterium]|nr:chorismate mutase [bacterium]